MDREWVFKEHLTTFSLQLFSHLCIQEIRKYFVCKDAHMRINESSWDSIIRVFSGFFLLYLGLGGELTGSLAVLANIFGLFLLLTGVIGFCPIYTLFRWKK